tara:strand:- start:71 stop:280 length:210 start_codon:yes stop_codon:yes gene_type:complete
MNHKYTFVNTRGDEVHAIGNIAWGWNFEWAEVEGERTQSIYDQMPMNTWCFVKSYEFNIGGVWKLVRIQ